MTAPLLLFGSAAGLVLALTACTAPSGVKDTALLVSKYTDKIGNGLGKYVTALNEQRDNDDRAIAIMHDEARSLAAYNATEFRISVIGKPDDLKEFIAELNALEPVGADALKAAPSTSKIKSYGKLQYDKAPLASASTAAAAVGQPRDLGDEAAVLNGILKQFEQGTKP